jgi:hypothetical protein
MYRHRRTHCMPSTLVRLEFSGFLPEGTPKPLLYAAPVDNEDTLHHRTVNACQTIRSHHGVFVCKTYRYCRSYSRNTFKTCTYWQYTSEYCQDNECTMKVRPRKGPIICVALPLITLKLISVGSG